MFGREAAVKNNLLESENPKYLGTDDSMINVEPMSKLYLVVAHNLNEARKARDGNTRRKITKSPEQLKIGDQYTCKRPHIKSIPAKIQRLLHNRTLRKKSSPNNRQPWTHNKGTPQRRGKRSPWPRKCINCTRKNKYEKWGVEEKPYQTVKCQI